MGVGQNKSVDFFFTPTNLDYRKLPKRGFPSRGEKCLPKSLIRN